MENFFNRRCGKLYHGCFDADTCLSSLVSKEDIISSNVATPINFFVRYVRPLSNKQTIRIVIIFGSTGEFAFSLTSNKEAEPSGDKE